jgi:predicted Na+-dependent transporter
MSITIKSAAETKVEQATIQDRNKRFVQIDAIGVGTAGAAAPFLPVFLTRLGATPVQIGLLTSMPGVTGLFLALWVGRFLQRQRNVVPWFSRSRLLVISAYTLTGVIPFFVQDDFLIYVILIIWALATLPQTMVNVGFSVVMNAVSGPEGRFDLMSRRWSILGITTAIATAIAGQVLDRVGFHLNYQIVFVGLSIGGLVSYYFSSRIQIPDVDPIPVISKGSIKSSVR